MSIRFSFAALTALLVFWLSVLGVWQYQDSQAKVQAVQWLKKTNQLLTSIQGASTELALERGLTASLLAQIESVEAVQSHDLWLSVQAQQDISNRRLAYVQYYLDELLILSPSHPIRHYQQKLQQLLEFMALRRQAVAKAVLTGNSALDVQHWIADSTWAIDVLYGMSGVGMLPLEGNIYSYASRPVVQDVLFTLGEYIGRERALLSSVLAREAPLSESERKALDAQHSLVEQAYKRIDVFLNELPEASDLARQRQEFNEQMQNFNNLRTELLAQSTAKQPYSQGSAVWFDQATLSISKVTALSQSLNERFSRQIADLSRNATQSRYLALLAFAALLLSFVISLYFTRKRVLAPLEYLTQAAQGMASGNLQSPIVRAHADELGTLAQAFEHMRTQLLADQEQQKRNQQEFKKLYTAIEQSVAAMLITDANGVVEFVNAQFCTITGYSQAELIGQQAGFWRSSADQSSYQEMWHSLKEGKVWVGEVLNKRKNAELYWSLVSISPVLNEQGEIGHFIDIHLDISEHKRLAQRLDFVSYYDQITGLPNRQFLAREFAKKAPLSLPDDAACRLISLSIGRLKHINDSLGWHVGDKVLMEVGWRLKSLCAQKATVAHQEGGKFMLLYPSLPEQDTQEQAQAIIEALHLPISVEHHSLQLIPKIGIASTSNYGHFDLLLKQANIALHYAEQAAAESVVVYDHSMNVDTQRRLHLEGALRQAIANNELELYYQPKVDTRSEAILAVEALLRWKHSETGQYISPSEFIPMAEDSGLIFALGEWVLKEACRQIKEFQTMGIDRFSVAVNVSVEQLKQPDFAKKVAQVLDESGIGAAYLELELTESLFMENPDQALLLLAELKQMGLKLAIDDFGTGYSSLSYLSQLPVDYLKIDRSFVERVTTDMRFAAIATSIIALGHRMGLKVIAEGIETEAQYRYLAQHQCDQMQGYFFGRPMPAQALAAVMLKQRTLALLKQVAR